MERACRAHAERMQSACRLHACTCVRAGYPTWRECLESGRMVFVPVCHPSGEHWVSVVLWKDMNEGQHPYRVMVLNSMQAYRKYDAKLARAMVRCCVESGYNQEGIWTCLYDVTAEYPIPLEQRPRNLCGVHVICHAFQAATNQLDKKTDFRNGGSG